MENYVANVIPHLQSWWAVIILLIYVMGVFFAFFSLVQAVSHKNKFNRSPAIFSFVAAVLLLNLPAFLDSLAMTIFNTSSEQDLSYSPPESQGSVYIEFAVYAIMLIGVLGVARGILLFKDTPNQASNFPKAIMHMVGGILAINIVSLLQGIGATIGGDVQTYIASLIG